MLAGGMEDAQEPAGVPCVKRAELLAPMGPSAKEEGDEPLNCSTLLLFQSFPLP